MLKALPHGRRAIACLSTYSLVLLLGACQAAKDTPNPTENLSDQAAAQCVLDDEWLIIHGQIAGGSQKTYLIEPVNIPAGTRRIEFLYGWSDINPAPTTGTDPNDTTVLDLGWWDQRGYKDAAGFRGWSGSRQARLDQGAEPGFIEAGAAERGYSPGPIAAGTWYVELGVPISSRNGANYEVHVRCLSQDQATPASADPVPPDFIAKPEAGWYHADFHMHGYHSHPAGPDAMTMTALAREALLDVVFYTEYVVNQHWDEIGKAQRANPDILIFPGREIITYSGHANTLGETRGVVEYRHGFEDISMQQIQQAALNEGALFQINHPTTFDIPGLEALCRGCQWDLENEVDWSQVHSMEIVTGPIIATSDQLGLSGAPAAIQNPFTRPAIDYWHDKLQQGFRITAVSGSDSKGAEAPEDRNNRGYGNSATAIYSEALSQAAISKAVIQGRAFVKTLGVDESPHIEMSVRAADGQTTGYGGELFVDEAEVVSMQLQIHGASGQRLSLYRNAQLQQSRLISSDPQNIEVLIARDPDSEGPLGSWWNFETSSSQVIFDNLAVVGEVITSVGNPVYLRPQAAQSTRIAPLE